MHIKLSIFFFLLSMSQETAKMSRQNHCHLQNKLQHQKYICALITLRVRISSRDNIQNPLIKFIFNRIKLDLWQRKQSVDLYVLISVAVGIQIHNKMVHVLVACGNPRHHEPLFRSNLLGAHYLQQPIAAACNQQSVKYSSSLLTAGFELQLVISRL